jgi:hypothetical protein
MGQEERARAQPVASWLSSCRDHRMEARCRMIRRLFLRRPREGQCRHLLTYGVSLRAVVDLRRRVRPCQTRTFDPAFRVLKGECRRIGIGW